MKGEVFDCSELPVLYLYSVDSVCPTYPSQVRCPRQQTEKERGGNTLQSDLRINHCWDQSLAPPWQDCNLGQGSSLSSPWPIPGVNQLAAIKNRHSLLLHQ